MGEYIIYKIWFMGEYTIYKIWFIRHKKITHNYKKHTKNIYNLYIKNNNTRFYNKFDKIQVTIKADHNYLTRNSRY